ncbi:MAG TPA: GNAT family N-acetyltransferase [Anaerolineales bacterium]|nr:GNAT family N-acetyltransferase [Anaerolineales bacterium]
MYVERVSEATDEIYTALRRLIPQLGPHKSLPTWNELTALIESQASTLLIARGGDGNGQIVGLLSLTVYRVPSGVRSIVEDLVVDEKMRRQGTGKALLEYAIRLAREAGASGVSLTSNPQREAANRMYQSMGFTLRQTNAYFYRLK